MERLVDQLIVEFYVGAHYGISVYYH